MKVLFVIRALDVGGSQRQLALLAAGLSQRGHEVGVVVLYRGGANEAAVLESGARIIGLDKSGRWDVVGPLSRLWRILRAERPDIVYAMLPTQTVLTALLMPWRGPTKLVFGIRSTGMPQSDPAALSALVYRLENRLSQRADLIVANASAARADAVARGMPGDRIVVIPNGIDVGAMRPDAEAGVAFRKAWDIGQSAFVIGIVARLDGFKDHRNFLSSAALFLRDHRDACFVVAGDGQETYRDSLKQFSASLGLSGHVKWIGSCDDVRAAFNGFDIATLSSANGEAFPNAVGEAMACGTPVAATDVGDVAAIVGRSGEVVPPRRPDLLCAAWSRLRQRLAEEPDLPVTARDRIVTNFSIDAMVDKTEEALRGIHAGPAPG